MRSHTNSAKIVNFFPNNSLDENANREQMAVIKNEGAPASVATKGGAIVLSLRYEIEVSYTLHTHRSLSKELKCQVLRVRPNRELSKTPPKLLAFDVSWLGMIATS